MPSYEQSEKSKLWSVRFRETTEDGVKNMRLSGFKTKREAQKGYTEYCFAQKNKKKDFTHSDAHSKLTFKHVAELYLEHTKTRVKPSSYFDIESKVSRLIIPYFGDTPIAEIQPVDILKWQQTLDGYSYKYKTGIRAFLTAIYRYAERYYDIRNIMGKVESFRNLEPKKQLKHWSPEQFGAFIRCVSDEEYSLFFRLLYITGCRKGEALALTWRDVNEQTRRISITKSLTRKVKGSSYEITTPKNESSNRDIEIPNNLVSALKELRTTQGGRLDDFVFGKDKPLAERTIDRRFSEAVALAGVPRIRIHDLRHSCASLLISEGVSIVAVSHRLGHSNIEQTLNTYSHIMPSDSDKITQILEGLEL